MKHTLAITSKNLLRKTLLIAIFILGATFSKSGSFFSQGWQWAKNGVGSMTEGGKKTCTDALGNVIIGGYFSSASMLIGGNTINNFGAAGTYDIFIAKFSPAGACLWVRRIGGSLDETLGGICTDASGKVYVSGYFNSSLVSDGINSLLNVGSANNVFLCCLDAPNGTPQWLSGFGGTYNEYAGDVAYSNAQSSIYLTGTYYASTLAIGSNTITNSNNTNTKAEVYIAKFTNLGVATWARSTGGANSDDFGYSIDIDANSYPCVMGNFAPNTTTTQIGPSVLTSYGAQDIFVTKYTDVGAAQWSKNFGSSMGGDYQGDLKVDASNNIYITGYYQTTAMNLGTFTLTPSGNYDAFVAELNIAGVVQWANKIGGADTDYGYGIALDQNSNVYVTGAYAGTVITVGSTTLANTNPGSTTDLFVAKYNNAGGFIWATKASGPGNEGGSSISSDVVGNVYVLGGYDGLTSFGGYTVNSGGGNDVFYAKIGCLTTSASPASTVCYGSSVSLSANGATTYSWSNGGSTATIVVTPTATTIYTVTGSAGACVGTPTTISVTVLSASVNAGIDYNLLCNQKQIISAFCIPASPTSVAWTPTLNLIGSTILNPTVTPGTTPIQYKVTVNLNNGCVARDSIIITPYAPTPSICIVTVDSADVNNEIYWDKTSYPSLDSMIIYREVTANVYKQIGSKSRHALSMFIDTCRSIGPANGDPNISTYRYKIQMRDTCGVYSAKSLWHNTVFFTRTNSTFFWVNNYMIEGGNNPVQTYSLMVCPNYTVSTTYTLVGTTTGSQNQLNDPNYNVYQANADWRVYADLGYICTPSYMTKNQIINPLATGAPVTKSTSNIQNNRPSIGIKENFAKTGLKVYPNPTNGKLNIEFVNGNDIADVAMINVLGQMIYSEKITGNKIISTEGFSKGIYTLTINRKQGRAVYKIVVE